MSEHFNQLTPAEDERLAILSEEAGEIVQAIGKIMRHGYESRSPNGGPSNREQLTQEIADLLVIAEMMVDAGDLDEDAIMAGMTKKEIKLPVYTHHQDDLFQEIWFDRKAGGEVQTVTPNWKRPDLQNGLWVGMAWSIGIYVLGKLIVFGA